MWVPALRRTAEEALRRVRDNNQVKLIFDQWQKDQPCQPSML
jgi:hypothetical protein